MTIFPRMVIISFLPFLFLFTAFPAAARAAAVVTPSERAEIVWSEEEMHKGIAKKDLYEDAAGRHIAVRLAESEKPHDHPEDLTAWLIRGKALLHIEDKSYPMSAGDVTRIPRRVMHWAEIEDGEVCEIYAIYHKEPGAA